MKVESRMYKVESSMKANSYQFIVFALCSLFLIPSCNFLSENPHAGIPEEDVITSATAVKQQAVLSLYNFIGSDKDGDGLQGTYRGIYDLQTFASNEAVIPVRGGDCLEQRGGVGFGDAARSAQRGEVRLRRAALRRQFPHPVQVHLPPHPHIGGVMAFG